jgi:hypothetical protein
MKKVPMRLFKTLIYIFLSVFIHAEDICNNIKSNLAAAITLDGYDIDTHFKNKQYKFINEKQSLPFSNPLWIKNVHWLKWNLVDFSDEGYTPDSHYKLLLVSEKINDKRYILNVGFMWGGWGESHTYNVYEINDDEYFQILKTKKLDGLKLKSIFPNTYYKANSWAYNFRNIFTHNNKLYILGGNDWDKNQFNVLDISGDQLKNACSFSNYRKMNEKYPFLALFDKMQHKISGCGYDETCKGTIGDMNCWHSGYLTNFIKYHQNKKLFTDIDRNKYTHYEKLLETQIFKLYSNSDIWTKRFSNTLKAVLPLAKKDLISLLKDQDNFEESALDEITDYILSKSIEQALDGSFIFTRLNSKDEFYTKQFKNQKRHIRNSEKIYGSGDFRGLEKVKEDWSFINLRDNKYTSDFYGLALNYIPYMSDSEIENIIAPNAIGKTLLMYAVQMNHYGAVEKLIDFYSQGVGIKDDDACTNIKKQSRTVMHYAAENASTEIMYLLIKKSYKTNVLDSQKNNLFYYLNKNQLIADDEKELGMEFFDNIIYSHFLAEVKPSFSCDKASNKLEKTICSNKTLSNYDKSLSILYGNLKKHVGFDKIKSSQTKWLKDLNSLCNQKDAKQYNSCLINEYRDRNYFLYKILESSLQRL